ncbi:MAG: asparagine synthase (glutamine-hydrolyzing) [Chitinophagales bacterium]|nr:asparagine synthase (glutamine-hydrolyzing) [Chitinophagales bacterium]
MCGIAGIIQLPAAGYGRDQLQKMTLSLAHRGPDGEGDWQNPDGSVLLGHRRLSVIDLSEDGQQPMLYLGRYTIVHNGELYNYVELKETLQQKGYVFRTKTDTEVIVAAYDCWQEECLQQFDGMFAFAIWDEKKRELFAARDRFGEKPFYYYYDHQRFLFASEMKALWAAGIEKSPNQKMLFNFITIGYTDNPARPEESFFEHIFKLPAASYLKFSYIYFQYTVKNYWDIDPEAEDPDITDEEAAEEFIALFQTAVQRRLRSDVAVGTSLSGGLDSSSIVAMLQALKSGNRPQHCFTAVFDGFEKNEAAFAAEVARQYDLQQHLVSFSEKELLQDWDKLCYQQEEPIGSASIYAQYKVYERARQEGITVLLDGQGADETMAGYSSYYKWYWQELFRKRKLYRSNELRFAKERGIRESFDYRNMIAAYFPSFASVVLERQYLVKAISQEDLTKDFVRLQSKEAYYTPPEYFNLNGVLYFNTCIHGLEELLRYADRNSMAHGCEVRLPFLSHELVEFIFTLPSKYKIRQGWSKWLLRKTMDPLLPAGITWRTDKVGFEPPQQQWMTAPAMQEAIREAKKTLVRENILQADVPDKPVQALSAHAPDNYDWRYFSAASLFK